jgi:hypothetical protein
MVEEAVTRLHHDVAYLLMPNPKRALDLDRAYLAIVREQSFAKGRESVVAPTKNIYIRAPVDESTGNQRRCRPTVRRKRFATAVAASPTRYELLARQSKSLRQIMKGDVQAHHADADVR